MTETVIITDVGPRDGLQNQPKVLSPAERLRLIEALVAARLPAVEIGSFVSPKAVPAMANTDQIAAGLPAANTHFSALIANMRGYEQARAAGIQSLNIPVAASNTMNEKNIRMDNQQAIALTTEIIARAKTDDVAIIPYIATAWECPFEGPVKAQTVRAMTRTFLQAGATAVVIADTIGAANPAQVKSLYAALISEHGTGQLGAHFHDTRGFGVANATAAFEVGVRRFDASIAGLGGCPFAPGASGNVATEDLVLLFEQMGIATGIDLRKLVAAAELAADLTASNAGGNALGWLRSQRDKGLL